LVVKFRIAFLGRMVQEIDQHARLGTAINCSLDSHELRAHSVS
jgi:hypothetical protein